MQGGRRKGEGGRGKAALRFGRFLAILPLLVAQAGAQTLVVPPTTPPGTPIVAKIEGLPDGARVAWKTSTGAGVVNVGKGRAHLWASGSHTVSAVVAMADPNAELIWLDAPFAVDGAPQPPPAPKTLAELAGADAAAIAGQLAALGRVLQPADAKFFPAALASSLAPWEKNAAHGPILKRLGSLTEHAAIQAEIGRVVAELGGGPAPVPPSPAPIPAAGLHVLIVEETDDRGRIPAGQLASLTTTKIQAAVEAAGGQFRQYDDDPAISDPLWSAARARPRTALPWIIVSHGAKGGVEQPLPASIDDTLALIRRFE